MTNNNVTGKAHEGRRILNDNVRKDYARLLEMIASPHEPDYEELEALANKYRFYYDETGSLAELHADGHDYTKERSTTEDMRKAAMKGGW